ncbi:MAG: hypothetical protein R6U28_11565 [Cyclonatronaceae bacterium]
MSHPFRVILSYNFARGINPDKTPTPVKRHYPSLDPSFNSRLAGAQ